MLLITTANVLATINLKVDYIPYSCPIGLHKKLIKHFYVMEYKEYYTKLYRYTISKILHYTYFMKIDKEV